MEKISNNIRLITLNIWGGHIFNPFLEFILSHQEVDIFCFQEVYHHAQRKISDDDREVSLNIFAELQVLLPGHRAFFRPTVNNSYGLGTFIKKNIEILEEGDIFIHDNPSYPGLGPTHSRNLQWIKCQIHDHTHTILNIHGLWNGRGKTDCPERILQSQKIRNFVDALDTPKILCGDFNLRPDTESLKIIEKGLNNLIQIYKVSSTRTSLYSKEEKFADYVFTSPEIHIHRFEVLKDEVSDHAPLFLEYML